MNTTADSHAPPYTDQFVMEVTAAIHTGKYPPGATANTLANIPKDHRTTLLHDAAETGNYPPGTTAEDLANCRVLIPADNKSEVAKRDPHYRPSFFTPPPSALDVAKQNNHVPTYSRKTPANKTQLKKTSHPFGWAMSWPQLKPRSETKATEPDKVTPNAHPLAGRPEILILAG